jgi:tRNA A37 threonylcarbamoyltransferase TsaD
MNQQMTELAEKMQQTFDMLHDMLEEAHSLLEKSKNGNVSANQKMRKHLSSISKTSNALRHVSLEYCEAIVAERKEKNKEG